MPCLPQTDCVTGCRVCKPHMSWSVLNLNHVRNNLNFSQGSCARRLSCKDKITANEERGNECKEVERKKERGEGGQVVKN